jgi:hypothetical protein
MQSTAFIIVYLSLKHKGFDPIVTNASLTKKRNVSWTQIHPLWRQFKKNGTIHTEFINDCCKHNYCSMSNMSVVYGTFFPKKPTKITLHLFTPKFIIQANIE